MIEVGGGNGPQLVYRIWSQVVLMELARQSLPKPEQGGQVIYEAILNFAKTTRPSLFKLKTVITILYGIPIVAQLGNLFNVDTCLAHPNYDDAQNADYRAASGPSCPRSCK